jgi:hypothetical protein
MDCDYAFILASRKAGLECGSVLGCDYNVRIHIPVLIEVNAEQIGCSREKQEAEEKTAQRFVD